MRKGFTLAEVLITLGIIGVVAALTLPVLLSNYRKNYTVTRLKKVYSTINQAVNLTQAELGEPAGWVLDCGSSGSPTCTTSEVMDWYKNTIGKYIISAKIVPDADNKGFYVYMTDGSVLFIPKYLYDMNFYITHSAINDPVPGKNYFNFRFNPTILAHQADDLSRVEHFINKGFEFYSWHWDGTREGLIDSGIKNYGCNASFQVYCGKLIQYDGWQIPNDYPVKF